MFGPLRAITIKTVFNPDGYSTGRQKSNGSVILNHRSMKHQLTQIIPESGIILNFKHTETNNVNS